MYRTAIIGWRDSKGSPRRQFEDAASVAAQRGGEVVTKGENVFNYMVIATQFFTSGVAIDDQAAESQAVENPWAYVRATTELPFDKKSDPSLPYFDDVTVRAVFDTIDLSAARPARQPCRAQLPDLQRSVESGIAGLHGGGPRR